MKTQRVKVANHQYIWLVLDDNHLPVQPIEVFIRHLHYTEKSPLKKKNRKLQDTVKQLRSQLEIVYGELYRLKKAT